MVVRSEVEGSRCATLKRFPEIPRPALGMKLLLATHNSNKTREFAQLLGVEFYIRDLTALRDLLEIAETGRSFEENAAIKATAVSKLCRDQVVIADDSGLEVDALEGAPGVFSARYSGQRANDEENVNKLLRELRGITNRSAGFRCAIAVGKNGGLITTVAGRIAGTITESPRGENGFGYDPIFVPEGFAETFAELSPETKNKISHRAAAVRALIRYFNTAPHAPEK
jgi:XTP/dITP diphosphohydrolase